MYRLSRINAPRATVAAFALVVGAMLLFGIIAQANGPAVMLETATHVVELSKR